MKIELVLLGQDGYNNKKELFMKKQEFLEALESKLDSLNSEDRKKVIRKYKSTITRRLNKNEKETKIILSFGDIDFLAEEILATHQVEKKDVKEEVKKEEKTSKKEEKITEDVPETKEEKVGYFQGFLNSINNLIDSFQKNNFKGNLKLALELLLIVIFISLLKLPFILLRDIILDYFNILSVSGDSSVTILIYRIIDIIYIIFAVLVFVNMIKKRFSKVKINSVEKK